MSIMYVEGDRIMLKIAENLVKTDREYQTLLWQCRMLEPEYLRIVASLPEKDREYLDRYITLCENWNIGIVI